MRITSALILEPCDFTRDGSLRKEAFAAMCHHDVVLSSGTVFKCTNPSDAKPKDAPVRRVRKAKVDTVIIETAEQPTPQ
jgi:hypothetical protein